MSRFAAGLLAGMIATAVVSILMVLETALGFGSQLGVIDSLVEASARQLGTARHLAVGWVAHLLIGTVLWSSLYALINREPTAARLSRGLQYGLFIWLLMMTVLMPLAGKGLFGLAEGWSPMIVALVLHLIYGAVLAHYYGHMFDPVRVVPRGRVEATKQAARQRPRLRSRRP